MRKKSAQRREEGSDFAGKRAGAAAGARGRGLGETAAAEERAREKRVSPRGMRDNSRARSRRPKICTRGIYLYASAAIKR